MTILTYKEKTMIKSKLTAAALITRQYGPWVSLAASALVIAADLRKS